MKESNTRKKFQNSLPISFALEWRGFQFEPKTTVIDAARVFILELASLILVILMFVVNVAVFLWRISARWSEVLIFLF